MIGTLDVISKGRTIVFYDFGRQQREHQLFGFDYPDSVDQRVAETLAGIDVMRALWTSEEPRHGAVANPGPVQKPHPPIWFGETEDGLLDACARFGDGWNTAPVGLDELRRRIGLLDQACAAVGRDRSEIDVSLEMQVLIGSPSEIRADVRSMVALQGDNIVDPEIVAWSEGGPIPEWFAEYTIAGSPDQVADQIRRYQNAGVDHFMFWFLDAPDERGMRQFSSDVLPTLRGEALDRV